MKPLNERKKKVLGYEDQGYKMKEDRHACLANAFQELKTDENSFQGWNKMAEDLNGLTMRTVGDVVEITYHKIITGLPEVVTRHDDDAKKFLDFVVSELKKRYKTLAKTSLEMKKVKEDKSVEKYSHMQAQTSWMFAGALGQAVAKYYVKYSRVFELDSE